MPRSGVRPRLLVPTLALLTTVTAVVSSLGAPLVPTIARDAGISVSAAQWTLTAALLSGAVATPLLGRLGGNRRRRRVLVVGMCVVTAGTMVAALPLGFPALVFGRALQGVGLGLTPLAMAVAREALPMARAGRVIALLSVTTVAGAGLGYPVTALIAQERGLAAAFWFGFGVCAATLTLTVAVVPQSASTADDRVDWGGAVLLAGGTTGLLLAVSQADPWGWASARVLGLAVGSATVLALWARRTWRSDRPLVDLRLARRKGVLAPNITAVAAGSAMYMLLTLVMILVQAPVATGYGLGEPVTVAGLLLVPYSLCSVLGSRLTIALRRWLPADLLLPLGCAIYLASTLGLAVWRDNVLQLFLVMAVAGLGSGCTFAAMPGLIVRHVPPEETGSALAFNQVLRYLGFSTGSALGLAVLEMFADDGRVTDQGFTAAILFAAAIWVAAIAGHLGVRLGVGPGLRRGPGSRR